MSMDAGPASEPTGGAASEATAATAGEPTNGAAPVALITGGTRGIGLAIAGRLGAAGHRVALSYLVDDEGSSLAEQSLADVGVDALIRQVDARDESACAAFVDEVVALWGRLDVVVANVGPMIERPTAESTTADWRAMAEGNVAAALNIVLPALPPLRRSRGCIVTLGSLNVEHARGADHHAAYNAAKAALVVWTRSWARAEGKHGVRANMVSPGIIDTAGLPPGDRASMPARIPLGRLGRPEEVADAVAFLASPRASYISGAVLSVSGGLWA